MPDANALNRDALILAILGRRFPSASQTTNALRWLATAYQDVWDAMRSEQKLWTFEIVSLSSLAYTIGDSTPTMPADYADTLSLFDSQGTPLVRVPRYELEAMAVAQGAAPGTPYWYAVTGRQVTVYPTPSANGTLSHSYRRRLSHKESDGVTVTAGFMDEGSDYPLWDDHHSILIPRAQALGLMELNDPTWQTPQDEYERQLERMKSDYEEDLPQVQWPRDPWW